VDKPTFAHDTWASSALQFSRARSTRFCLLQL